MRLAEAETAAVDVGRTHDCDVDLVGVGVCDVVQDGFGVAVEFAGGESANLG